jgi:nucleoside-diphosphate-sugar epimerase
MNSKKILITGVSGKVGTIIAKALWHEYEVTGVDVKNSLYVPTLVADTTDIDSILPAFRDIHTVIDLASEPSQFAPWEVVYRNNIQCTYNCLEAAHVAGVERVIFASSNHATGLYEKDFPYSQIVEGNYEGLKAGSYKLLSVEEPVRPDGPYGISKAFGEAAARYFSEEKGVPVICLRIGTVNQESTPQDKRQFSTLLTHSDLLRLVRCCIEAPRSLNFGVYYGVSNNTWRFWDIANSFRDIGYDPRDNAEDWR